MFRHPKYYKELRKLRNKLQAREDSTANSTRGRVAEPQASSVKPQAPEASSGKHQAPSNKRQA
jgi:hypothetical protein